MYNVNEIQFVGKHDFDRESAEVMASNKSLKSFSVGIFKWELKSNGNQMKRGKVIVRVSGKTEDKDKVFYHSEKIVELLDCDEWDGRKTVVVNW